MRQHVSTVDTSSPYPEVAQSLLGVNTRTLARWAREGRIGYVALPGGRGERLRRLYDVAGIVQPPPPATDDAGAETQATDDVIYARVSTGKQAEDLKRQIQDLQRKHPEARRVFSDVASGLNFRRPGLQRLLEAVLQRRVSTIHIAHRDRL